MTEQEAILNLELLTSRWEDDEEMYHDQMDISIDQEFVNTLYTAIKALEEVEQYRAIGTVEECREAVDKHRAKRPTYEGDGYAPDGTFVWDEWLCPCCGSGFEVEYEEHDYCPNCGQHILWEVADER